MSTIKIRNKKEGESFHFKADPLNPKFNHLPIVEKYLEKKTWGQLLVARAEPWLPRQKRISTRK